MEKIEALVLGNCNDGKIQDEPIEARMKVGGMNYFRHAAPLAGLVWAVRPCLCCAH